MQLWRWIGGEVRRLTPPRADPPRTNGTPVRRYRTGVPFVVRGAGRCQADASSTSRLRVRFGSTGMPGPVVVETVIFLM